MKSKIVLGALLIGMMISNALLSQNFTQGPTGVPVGFGTPPVLAGNAWYRGGNLPVGLGGINNVFGTFFNSPIHLFSNSLQRMTIGHVTPLTGPSSGVIRTRIGINQNGNSPITTPLSLLHLGYNGPGVQGGDRDWMDIGMMTMGGSDNIWIGLKEEGVVGPLPNKDPSDHMDAVINWGDNPNAGNGPDFLRFIFTSPPTQSTGNMSTNNGMELLRLNPGVNQPGGSSATVGIGNFYFFGQPTRPNRRLEILDADPNSTTGTNTGQPQLRLTYTYNANPNAGRWTDFQTTNNGDLAILPFNSFLAPPFNFTFVGIQTTTPGNQLEINYHGPFFNQNSPNPGLGTGFSGLRFTDLRSSSTPYAVNPGPGVLSLDANGDVIYVPATPPGAGFGALCGGPQFNLPGDWRVGLGGFNLYFDGNGGGNAVNNVIIGKNCINPLGKLDVLQSSGAPSSIGINVVNTGNSTAFPNSAIGLKCSANNPTDLLKIGAWIEAPSLPGLSATALYIPPLGGKVTIGYGNVLNTGDRVEILGNFNLVGNFNGTGTQNYVSDVQLKTNMNAYLHGLDVIRQVSPITYNYNGLANTDGSRTYLGVKAQDIAQINFLAPYAIDTTQMRLNPNDQTLTDILTVSPDAIFFTAINAIKELDSTVTALQNQLNNMRVQSSNSGNTQTVDLESDIILYQNMPNPFSEETVINFFLPENVTTARMIFYDETGRVIKEEVIENRGNGSVTVNAQNLAAGIYSYSLEVNGKNIQTRKMQKVK
jgi:hypothetical protein